MNLVASGIFMDCIICLKDLSEEPVRVLDCGHAHFHKACVNMWLEITPSCPTCKRVVPAAVEVRRRKMEAEERKEQTRGAKRWKRRHLGLPENEWVMMHLAFEASLVEQ